MPPSPTSPDQFPFAFDGDDLVFVGMDRAAYRRSIFLDARISPASAGEQRLPVGGFAAPAPPPTTGWIAHVAHCGSTLLARALDRDGGGLVLREPLALRQLGLEPGARGPALLDLVAGLLARRYPGDPPTIVKTNVPVNFILPALLAGRPRDPVILLHYPLAAYLAAILRSSNHRGWLRGITTALAQPIAASAGPLPDDDAGRAAMLWLAQQRVFADVLARFPNSVSLDAELFFARPAAVIVAAAGLFGQPMAPEEAEAIVAGPLFATYSKQPGAAFSDADRRARRAAQATALAPEVARAEALVAAQSSLPVGALARPLLG